MIRLTVLFVVLFSACSRAPDPQPMTKEDREAINRLSNILSPPEPPADSPLARHNAASAEFLKVQDAAAALMKSGAPEGLYYAIAIGAAHDQFTKRSKIDPDEGTNWLRANVLGKTPSEVIAAANRDVWSPAYAPTKK